MLAPIIPTIKKATNFCLGLAKPKSPKTKNNKISVKNKTTAAPITFRLSIDR